MKSKTLGLFACPVAIISVSILVMAAEPASESQNRLLVCSAMNLRPECLASLGMSATQARQLSDAAMRSRSATAFINLLDSISELGSDSSSTTGADAEQIQRELQSIFKSLESEAALCLNSVNIDPNVYKNICASSDAGLPPEYGLLSDSNVDFQKLAIARQQIARLTRLGRAIPDNVRRLCEKYESEPTTNSATMTREENLRDIERGLWLMDR